MEGLLPLAVLIGASGSLLAYTRSSRRAQRAREGYEDIVNPAVEAAFGNTHANYVRKGAEKYNPIMNLLNPKDNILLPRNFTPGEAQVVDSDLKKAVVSANARATPLSRTLTPSNTASIQVNKDNEGTGLRRILQCEAVKSSDCSAFDNPNFALSCGICIEGGTDSGANPTLGGLFISEDDRLNAEASAKRMGSRNPNYFPTVGKCDPNRFVTSKKQCERLKAKLDCEKKQNFDTTGCNQCFQDGAFHYIDSEVPKDNARLIVSGTGSLTVTLVGSEEPPKDYELNNSTQQIEFSNLVEGSVVELEIGDETAELSGYLVGTTPGGEFRMDLFRLVQVDAVTGAKPRVTGFKDINGENYTTMRPGRGKDSMKLQVLNTFTFLNVDELDAQECGSAPFIAKQTSATFLESSPCFKKGSGPGKYSLECLQQLFESAGCTAEGSGYPSTQARASALMVNGYGQMLSIGQIADRVFQSSLAAATGLTKAGQKLSLEAWDKESQFCTGKRITSPCDIVSGTGQVSTDCLSYLWQNTGATDPRASVGPTYSNSDSTASMNDKRKARYCTSSGTMAPMNANGQQNSAAIAEARKQGSIQNIKAFYDNIHKKANDNTLDDEARKDALQKCYGVDFATPSADAESMNAMGFASCTPSMLATSITSIPGSSTGDYDVNVAQNVILTVTVIPTTMGTPNLDYNIANVTSDGSPNYMLPAVALIGGSNKVRAFVTTPKEGRFELASNLSCPVNTPTNITVSYIENVLTLKIDGQQSETVSRQCPVNIQPGSATVAVGALGWIPFIGTLKNLAFCSFAGNSTNVLDSKAGRTKRNLGNLPAITVIEASYGANVKASNQGNITQQMKNKADGKPTLEQVVHPNEFGGLDPAPGYGKIASVIYHCGDNRKKETRGADMGLLYLNCDKSQTVPRINIVEASYGVNCNPTNKGNVTRHAMGWANNKQKGEIPFNDGAMGDPAFNCYKSGEVSWSCGDGVVKTAKTMQNQSVLIDCSTGQNMLTKGNNGSVSCSRYCGGLNGKPWNNELPANWNGATCAGTNDPSANCDTVVGLRPQGIGCICAPAPEKGWNTAGL